MKITEFILKMYPDGEEKLNEIKNSIGKDLYVGFVECQHINEVSVKGLSDILNIPYKELQIKYLIMQIQNKFKREKYFTESIQELNKILNC